MDRIDELKIIIAELHILIGNKAYHELKRCASNIGDCSRTLARLDEIDQLSADLRSTCNEYLKIK